MRGAVGFAGWALRRRFGHRWAVDGVSITLDPGEIVGLLGPNGAGKSVTFYMLAGMIQPTEGRVCIDGIDVTRRPMHERARLGLSYLPQESSIFHHLSAADNVAVVLEARGASARDAHHRARAALEEFGLLDIAETSADRLSGGERRRLEVARAVSLSPRFLLLDEPFAGIDPLTVELIRTMLRDVQRRGIGILLTDHNVREALALSGRAYVLLDGRVLAEGSPAALVQNAAVRANFLGEFSSPECDPPPRDTAADSQRSRI